MDGRSSQVDQQNSRKVGEAMTRKWKVILAVVAVCGLAFIIPLLGQLQNAPTALSVLQLIPGGAIAVFEADDFGRLATDWGQSKEKAVWIGSANYQELSRSRLAFRLEEIAKAYTVAGFQPNYAWLQSIAGKGSALAVYSFQRNEYLFLTRLPSANAAVNVLMQRRNEFTARTVANRTFYVKSVEKGSGQAAFSATDGWLLLSTREDLMANALAIIAGQSTAALAQESWMKELVSQRKSNAELRFFGKMEALSAEPRVKQLWLPSNSKEWSAYRSGIIQTTRDQAGFHESRLLFRKEALTAAEGSSATWEPIVADTAPFAMIKATHQPNAPQVDRWIRAALGSRSSSTDTSTTTVPALANIELISTEEDYETKLSGATGATVAASSDVDALAEWRKALSQQTVLQALLAGFTAQSKELFTPQSVLILEFAQPPTLPPVELSSSRKLLIKGNRVVIGDAAAVDLWLQNESRFRASVENWSYRFRVKLSGETDRFRLFMRQLDASQLDPAASPEMAEQRAPLLFSENIPSLLGVFSRISVVDVSAKESADRRTEQIDYRF
jgi:hypothetical protein